MNSHTPQFAIGLLCWNHSAFLKQCIESLAAQTCRDIEVVFLDNCSTDGSYELALSLLEATGLPYQAFRNEQPQSISRNVNFLFSHTRAPLFTPLSTDDWLLPEFIAEKLAFFAQHPEVAMVFNGAYMYFEEEGTTYPVDNAHFRRGRIYKDLLHQDGVVFFVGCSYRRSVLETLGGWDEGQTIEDMDMFLRIAQQYDIDYIDKPLVYYRKVGSSAANNIPLMVKGWEQFYTKYKSLPWIDMKKWLGAKYRSYAALATDRNQKEVAWKLLKKSIRLAPLDTSNYRTLLYLLRK